MWPEKKPEKVTIRNYVIAKYLCKDPYDKYKLWQMIATKGECWMDRNKLLDTTGGCCKTNALKNIPHTHVICATVVSWSLNIEPIPEDKHERTLNHIISFCLKILLEDRRKAIAKETKEKGCKIYEFIPPKDIRLQQKEPSLKWGGQPGRSRTPLSHKKPRGSGAPYD